MCNMTLLSNSHFAENGKELGWCLVVTQKWKNLKHPAANVDWQDNLDAPV